MGPSIRTAEALARFAALPSEEPDPRRLLRRLAVLAGEAVPSAAWVSIALGSPLDPPRLASDSGVARDFDSRQLRAREGPWRDAYATGSAVDASDVTADARWPVLARLATETPVRSARSVPLRESAPLAGVLNLYAPDRSAFAADRRLCDLVATAVGGALRSAAHGRALRDRAGHLEQALTSRASIDQAKGMLMARFGGGPDDAFARLVTMSNRLNVRLRTLAVQITEGRLEELLDQSR